MGLYFLHRILGAIPLLLGIAVISFVFMHAMPGGPDAMLARNSHMTAEQLANVRRSLGIDQPIPVQFARWLGNVAQGDFGLSFTQFRPVSQVIGERIPHTFKLVTVASCSRSRWRWRPASCLRSDATPLGLWCDKDHGQSKS